MTDTLFATEPATDLCFGVLGPLALWSAGARETLTAPKLRGLLTLMLLDSVPVPAEQVRFVLDEGERWRDNTGPMHVAVHRLRRWLMQHGGHRLELEPAGYRLTVVGGEVDARRFRHLVTTANDRPDPAERAERLMAALALWRGPVGADAPAAVRQQHAARQLERLRRQATVDLAVTCLDAGLSGQALPLIERAAAEAPYDEQTQSLFALSLAACGLQAEALDVIERTRQTLATELGIDPGHHLRDAQLRILRP
ncbi:AfsR/SARP family transcriptional regulator [Actinoplanes sp. NPDC026619]|uniref:AfsR/SARP family transcriptional regulator n=1 Tax=Actinoplanes sp. NPDC026619 TaxID=3155798 RepID=UPI0033F5A2A0